MCDVSSVFRYIDISRPGWGFFHVRIMQTVFAHCISIAIICCSMIKEAKVAETNEASRGILEKIGFSKETKLRNRFYNRKSNNRENVLVYSMTRDEYEKNWECG